MQTEDWKDIYDLTPCYFFSFSNNGLITRINATLLQHLGYSADEVIGVKKLEDLLTVGSRIFFQTHFYPLIKMQERADEIFLSFKSSTNTELPVLLNVVLIRRGETFEIHCGGMQISQRNRFEKELLEAKNVAEKALLENDDLVRLKVQLELNQTLLEKQLQNVKRINNEHHQIDKVLSHDLQEPLRKISMFSSMILSKARVDDDTREKLQRIAVSTDKIRNLIDSMQRFHLLDYKKLTLSPVDLRIILEKARLRANFSVDIVCADNFPPLMADAELLKNLFQELISNAIKFHDKRSPDIVVTADVVRHNVFREIENRYRFEEFVRICFTDNGTGFENKYSHQIFDLFKKLHPNDGLGLGLAYCKKIVELHEGFISVDSKINEGTTFNIYLPSKVPHLPGI